MGRIIAIDYGRKRTGLAVTDMLQIIANGLTTVPSGEAVSYLTNYTLNECVDLFVVGYPKQLNNEPSENLKYVEAFVKNLNKALPDIPVKYYDERFTSVMAHTLLCIKSSCLTKNPWHGNMVPLFRAFIELRRKMETA